MTLRGRILMAGALFVLGPLLIVVLAIREEMSDRLAEQYTARVDSLVSVIEADLEAQSVSIRSRLRALGTDLARRNDVRLALANDASDRTALLDWAEAGMGLAGLDALQLHDARGTILSSGHFRNDFDRVDDALTGYFDALPAAVALAPFRTPNRRFLALARSENVRLGDRDLILIGGVEMSARSLRALGRGDELVVSLLGADLALSPDADLAARFREDATSALERMRSSGEFVVREIPLAAVPALRAAEPSARDGSATIVVTHSLTPMHAILRSLDWRLALTWAVVALGTLFLAQRLSRSIARPLEELATQARTLDLDRLDVEFRTDRTDEVGTLSRLLAEMTGRLRGSVSRLREAERRATFGELSRQVNHDLKNAFTPLRNVIRHLSEVADEAPQDLPRVYDERRPTLDAGLGYLQDLATNWSRLSARGDRSECDVAAIVHAVSAGRLVADGGPIRVHVAPGAPPAWADPTGLRRIVENLVANACESLEGGGSEVVVSVESGADERGPAVQLVVADNGPGIPEAVRRQVFDPFYTTKAGGSGLGLAIVRRFVSDFEGTIRLEGGPGQGARFVVTLPAGPVSARPDSLPPPPPLTSDPTHRPGGASS